jgi:phosphate:Na+ symporter
VFRATSGDLVHQAANAHTGVMLLGMLPLVPLAGPLARVLRRYLHFRTPEVEPCHLDPAQLPRPEQALCACIRELQRMARLGAHSLRRNAALLLKPDARLDADIMRDENVLDEIQLAMREYLTALTTRRLSRRQALMVQHLERCMTDIERIGDHNNNLRELSASRHSRGVTLPRPALEQLVELFQLADAVLRRVIESLNPDLPEFQAAAQAILDARDAYAGRSAAIKSAFMEQTAAHAWTPLQGMTLGDYAMELDRIVRHSRLVALVERHPYFWIKREKLDRTEPEAECPDPIPESNRTLAGRLPPDDFP